MVSPKLNPVLARPAPYAAVVNPAIVEALVA